VAESEPTATAHFLPSFLPRLMETSTPGISERFCNVFFVWVLSVPRLFLNPAVINLFDEKTHLKLDSEKKKICFAEDLA
jgi:hypothetical protein